MFKIESYKKGIILSTIFNVFNKGLTFLNGLVVAYFFGADEGTDIFFFVYNSLIILGTFLMNTNSSVIVPESMRIRSVDGEHQAMKFLNFFISLYAGVAIAATALILFNITGFFSAISSFDDRQLQSHRFLLYLSLPLFALTCLISLLADILTSYKFFTIPMAVGIVNGLLAILMILAFHKYVGIQSVFYGFFLAYLFNISFLVYLLKKNLHWRFSIINHRIEKRIWKNFGFAQFGNLASALSLYTPMYILSGFNAGIITALTFAQQISSLPNSLITTQFSSVAAIKFNELFHNTDLSNINKVFSNTADFLHFVMTPLSFIIFFYSDEIVSVLLGFTAIDQNISGYISFFLKYLGFLLPFHVTNTLISRLFMASHKIKEAFWYQIIFNIVQIGAVYFFVKKLGVSAYPITLLVIYFTNTLLYLVLKRYYFNFITYGKIIKNLFAFIIINAIIATSIYYLFRNTEITRPWLTMTIGVTMHLSLLLILNHVLHINDQVTLQLRLLGHRIINRKLAGEKN